jgi:hypothetical protein
MMRGRSRQSAARDASRAARNVILETEVATHERGDAAENRIYPDRPMSRADLVLKNLLVIGSAAAMIALLIILIP